MTAAGTALILCAAVGREKGKPKRIECSWWKYSAFNVLIKLLLNN